MLKEQAWHGYAVDHRFVQCGGVKKPRNASIGVGSVCQHGTLCGQMSSLSTERPVSVSPHYAMIARRVERRDALRSSMAIRPENPTHSKVSR